MTWFIDRRLNGKNKSAVNRQRFLRRYKAQIKQSISEAINKRSVTDIDSGESVSIPTDDINEPMFHQGRGGCVTASIRETTTLYRMTASSVLRAAAAVAGAVKGSQRRRRRPGWFCLSNIER
jgi:hypothetical protein